MKQDQRQSLQNPAQGKERTRLPEEERAPQNLPIRSEMKIRRAYQSEPIDELSWAYMRLLREHDKTKRVYEIDPYVEVYQLRENTYSLLMESLDGAGDCWMYLIVGPEKAMLIDTAFGLGDLRGLADELSGGKPLIVVNTHGHFDHGYGNCQFDRVYCHEYEVPSLQAQNARMWDYLFEEETGRGIWAEFDRRDLVPFAPYEVIGCADGTCFDLGQGYEVELVFLGGHTSEHAGYLDKRNRVFYAGDDILSMRVGVNGPKAGDPFGRFASVTTLRDNLEKLNRRLDEFDAVCPGHFIQNIENTSVSKMLDACNQVLRAPLKNYDFITTRNGRIQYHKFVQGLGTLAYRETSI